MKTNKLVGLLLVACALFVQTSQAQDRRPDMSWEKMQDMQIDFMAQSLSLSDKDTEKLKEVYKEYSKEMRTLMGTPRRPKEEKKNDGEPQNPWKTMSDEEVEAMIKGRFEQSRKMLDLHEKYYDKYRKFLSPKQIQKIYDMEMMNMGRVQQEINRRNMMRGFGNGQQQGWKAQ